MRTLEDLRTAMRRGHGRAISWLRADQREEFVEVVLAHTRHWIGWNAQEQGWRRDDYVIDAIEAVGVLARARGTLLECLRAPWSDETSDDFMHRVALAAGLGRRGDLELASASVQALELVPDSHLECATELALEVLGSRVLPRLAALHAKRFAARGRPDDHATLWALNGLSGEQLSTLTMLANKDEDIRTWLDACLRHSAPHPCRDLVAAPQPSPAPPPTAFDRCKPAEFDIDGPSVQSVRTLHESLVRAFRSASNETVELELTEPLHHVNWGGAMAASETIAILRWGYEHAPCPHCRLEFARLLHQANGFDAATLAELPWDCSPEVREWARSRESGQR